MLNQNVTMT